MYEISLHLRYKYLDRVIVQRYLVQEDRVLTSGVTVVRTKEEDSPDDDLWMDRQT